MKITLSDQYVSLEESFAAAPDMVEIDCSYAWMQGNDFEHSTFMNIYDAAKGNTVIARMIKRGESVAWELPDGRVFNKISFGD